MYFIRCPQYVKNRIDGFSLLEISIALTIIGLVSVVGLGAMQRWKEQQQRMVTQTHQEQILTAIALYGVRTGHFPYPADPRSPPDSFGLAKTPEGVPKDQVGIVPYRTLGLPEAIARDGYGRYFTYAGGSSGHDICTNELAFPLNVFQRTSGFLQIITPGEEEPIVVILISHGANGYGAWERGMGKAHQNLSGIHGPDEYENAKAAQSFIMAPLSYERPSYYDDHVVWITRSNLLAVYANTNNLI